MKTIACCLFLTFLVAGQAVNGQNPIPSYNVPVCHIANFQEQGFRTPGIKSVKGKRVMNVKARRTDGLTTGQATVWIYSLDLQDILGPYTVVVDETLSVEIDEREWGVLVQSEDHLYVDVWIDEEEPLGKKSIVH